MVAESGETNEAGAPARPDAFRGWARPEAPPGPAAVLPGGVPDGAAIGVPPVGADGAPRWRDRAPEGLAPRPPVALKALTLSDVFDGAWEVLRVRPRAVFGLSAMIIVPAELLASWLVRGYGSGLDLVTLVQAFFPFFGRHTATQQFSAVAGIAVLSLAYAYLGVAVAHLLVAWYGGRDLSGPGAARAALRQSPAILATFVLLALPKALSVWILVLPAVFVFPLFLLVAPVIAFEHAGPIRAIQRSTALVSRRYIVVVCLWTVWLILERIADLTLGFVPTFVASFLPEAAGSIVDSAGWAFAQFITAPVVAAFGSLVYLDLRVRKEGLDLEVQAADAFG